ncbi:MAG: anthranilate synthase component I family protein [Planctomycetes bacterium]|nr:anthranilate synthase component I family protein [Planctomycetota bacterium]
MAPLRSYPLPTLLTPPAVAQAWRRRGPIVVLETGRPNAAHGEQTLVAGLPVARFEWSRGRARIEALRAGIRWPSESDLAQERSPFHALERCVQALGGDAPLPCGAYGWFGYEATLPAELPRLEPWPDGWFLLTDVVVRFDRPGAPPTLLARDDRLARELQAELEEVAAASKPELATRSTADRRHTVVLPFTADDLDAATYSERFAQARASLAAGESYQLCFTYPLTRPLPPDGAFRLWERLRRDHPAPFSAYVEEPRFALVSCSPERFLRVDADRRVEARPMKGTASKPLDAVSRATASRELQASGKALAENLMIADLLRNDLGRVCRLGSVRASQPALVEEHATLLQMVSVIEGDLDRGRSTADLLASAFPPGSMTGAPKVRSIELLRALERSPRGPYAGILGYLASGGVCDWSVVIRTALCVAGQAQVNVGGGLVWDSTALEEWQESRDKAQPLLCALAEIVLERSAGRAAELAP